jgi:hypothetical protein
MLYLSAPMDIPALGQALLGSVALRDRVVVVRLTPAALDAPEHVEGLGRTLALMRALDLRVIVVHDARRGEPATPPTKDATPALVAAIARHDQRALALLPHGVVRTLPMLPFPLIDQALLIQLCSLRYVPILTLPVVDEAAAPLDLAAELVAGTIGKFLDAALIVHVHVGQAEPPPQVEGEPRAIAVSAASPDALLADLLLNAAVKRVDP